MPHKVRTVTSGAPHGPECNQRCLTRSGLSPVVPHKVRTVTSGAPQGPDCHQWCPTRSGLSLVVPHYHLKDFRTDSSSYSSPKTLESKVVFVQKVTHWMSEFLPGMNESNPVDCQPTDVRGRDEGLALLPSVIRLLFHTRRRSILSQNPLPDFWME